MNKTDLLKPGSTRLNELHALSRQINARENTLATLRTKTLDCASAWVCEVMLQGQALLKAKSFLDHGKWLDWLPIHCPQISSRMAQRYMLVASNGARQPTLEIDQSVSLRSALALCIDPDQSEQTKAETKSWPAGLEFSERMARSEVCLKKHDVSLWPSDWKEKVLAHLDAIARPFGYRVVPLVRPPPR